MMDKVFENATDSANAKKSCNAYSWKTTGSVCKLRYGVLETANDAGNGGECKSRNRSDKTLVDAAFLLLEV